MSAASVLLTGIGDVPGGIVVVLIVSCVVVSFVWGLVWLTGPRTWRISWATLITLLALPVGWGIIFLEPFARRLIPDLGDVGNAVAITSGSRVSWRR